MAYDLLIYSLKSAQITKCIARCLFMAKFRYLYDPPKLRLYLQTDDSISYVIVVVDNEKNYDESRKPKNYQAKHTGRSS